MIMRQDTDEESKIIYESDFGNFEFLSHGQYVAVYYDNDFYVGRVVVIKTKHEAEVSFLQKCLIKSNAFRWSKSDIDNVKAEFVFDWNFELTSCNGRMWQVTGEDRHNTIIRKYEFFKEIYC